jgi:hypothetical protein
MGPWSERSVRLAARGSDVLLPVANGPELRLRMVVKPEKPLAFLLAKLGLALPKGSKKIENVVEKNEGWTNEFPKK